MINLTSIGFTNSPELRQAIMKEYPTSSRIAILVNAAAEKEQNEYAQLAKEQFHELGYSQVDFVDITKQSDQAILQQTDLLYILGGNTFALMHDINLSGFKSGLIELINEKGCIGVSAGSIILGNSIATASIGEGDANNVGLKDLSGLGILDYDVSPHYIEQDETEIAAYEKNTGHRVERIPDGAVKIL